jgi:4-hydroxybenzoate polyprenyltransferase
LITQPFDNTLSRVASLRTFLILGRVSNLPTVWSNCVAGWWLGGGGNFEKLPLLLAGVTLLYVGGMFLNDAFDADFDRQRRKERPIPSGAITLQAVWRWGFVWLAAGLVLLFVVNLVAGALGIGLALCILLYDAIHKLITFSPVLMGSCRFWVYLIAAAAGIQGVTGWAIWCGLALMAYVVGLSFLARRESTRGPAQFWPVSFLAAPILVALLMNVGPYREPALLVSLVLALWAVRCLQKTFWTGAVNVGRTVSGLLAGIVFVDWLAVAPVALEASRELGGVFLILFLAALLFQRFIPAT